MSSTAKVTRKQSHLDVLKCQERPYRKELPHAIVFIGDDRGAEFLIGVREGRAHWSPDPDKARDSEYVYPDWQTAKDLSDVFGGTPVLADESTFRRLGWVHEPADCWVMEVTPKGKLEFGIGVEL